jgi:hypothetical protein
LVSGGVEPPPIRSKIRPSDCVIRQFQAVALQLPQIADVANMVAFARLIHIVGFGLAVQQRFDFLHTFKQQRGIFASAAEIIIVVLPTALWPPRSK